MIGIDNGGRSVAVNRSFGIGMSGTTEFQVIDLFEIVKKAEFPIMEKLPLLMDDEVSTSMSKVQETCGKKFSQARLFAFRWRL